MLENDLWKKVRPLMEELDPIRIEVSNRAGVPDVNYVSGWVELKVAKKGWPARKGTPLRLPHYTQDQRNFGIARSKAGGRCFLLLGVELDYLLFEGRVAAKYLGYAPKDKLLAVCLAHWEKTIKQRELICYLTEN